jgi:hypothetical protein
MPETEKGDWLVPKMRHTKNKINFSSLSLDHLPPPLLRFATEFNTARMPTRSSLSRCRSSWVSCTVATSAAAGHPGGRCAAAHPEAAEGIVLPTRPDRCHTRGQQSDARRARDLGTHATAPSEAPRPGTRGRPGIPLISR